jgi:hypothetical protein
MAVNKWQSCTFSLTFSFYAHKILHLLYFWMSLFFYLPFFEFKFFSCYPGSVLRQLMLSEADFPEGTVDDQ